MGKHPLESPLEPRWSPGERGETPCLPCCLAALCFFCDREEAEGIVIVRPGKLGCRDHSVVLVSPSKVIVGCGVTSGYQEVCFVCPRGMQAGRECLSQQKAPDPGTGRGKGRLRKAGVVESLKIGCSVLTRLWGLARRPRDWSEALREFTLNSSQVRLLASLGAHIGRCRRAWPGG